MRVPFSALLTTDSVPAGSKGRHEGISVHGLLASFLAFGIPEDLDPYRPWIATWPFLEEFENTMPILWPPSEAKDLNRSNGGGEPDFSRSGSCPLPPDISGRWTTTSSQNSPPSSNRGLLAKQKARFDKDWAKASSAIPAADREKYLYYWLLVNTRTFYYEQPGKRKEKEKTAREDRMALCPFADYFNHANGGVGQYSPRIGSDNVADRKG